MGNPLCCFFCIQEQLQEDGGTVDVSNLLGGEIQRTGEGTGRNKFLVPLFWFPVVYCRGTKIAPGA